MTQTIDQTIQTLFKKLEQRKASVASLKAEIAKSWKTNGTFRLIGSSSTTNIQTASRETILEIATHVEILTTAAANAATKLELEIGKLQGYTVDEWYADFKKRLATINLRDEEAQLATIETRLNQVLSPEERRRIEVELLAKDLGV